MALDEWLFRILHGLSGRSEFGDAMLVFLSEYFPIILIAFALLYLLRASFPDKEKMVALVSALVALLLSRLVITESIRLLLPRERPFFAYDVPALFAEVSASFPSGHATFLFAVGGSLFYLDKKVGALFMLGALLACAARVAAGVHYPSDVVGGALIGFAVAYLVHRYLSPYVAPLIHHRA